MSESRQWLDETCVSCVYQLGGSCRRRPPVIVPDAALPSYTHGTWPSVMDTGFERACSEWEVSEQFAGKLSSVPPDAHSGPAGDGKQ